MDKIYDVDFFHITVCTFFLHSLAVFLKGITMTIFLFLGVMLLSLAVNASDKTNEHNRRRDLVRQPSFPNPLQRAGSPAPMHAGKSVELNKTVGRSAKSSAHERSSSDEDINVGNVATRSLLSNVPLMRSKSNNNILQRSLNEISDEVYQEAMQSLEVRISKLQALKQRYQHDLDRKKKLAAILKMQQEKPASSNGIPLAMQRYRKTPVRPRSQTAVLDPHESKVNKQLSHIEIVHDAHLNRDQLSPTDDFLVNAQLALSRCLSTQLPLGREDLDRLAHMQIMIEQLKKKSRRSSQ